MYNPNIPDQVLGCTWYARIGPMMGSEITELMALSYPAVNKENDLGAN